MTRARACASVAVGCIALTHLLAQPKVPSAESWRTQDQYDRGDEELFALDDEYDEDLQRLKRRRRQDETRLLKLKRGLAVTVDSSPAQSLAAPPPGVALRPGSPSPTQLPPPISKRLARAKAKGEAEGRKLAKKNHLESRHWLGDKKGTPRRHKQTRV